MACAVYLVPIQGGHRAILTFLTCGNGCYVPHALWGAGGPSKGARIIIAPLPGIRFRNPAHVTGRVSGSCSGPGRFCSWVVARIGGWGVRDVVLRRRGLRYRLGQNGSGVTARCRLHGRLQQRFSSGRKIRPQLGIHVLGILDHALEEHQPNRDLSTAKSLLQAFKPRDMAQPAASDSPDRRVKRHRRFALVESDDMISVLPCFRAYIRPRGRCNADERRPKSFGGGERRVYGKTATYLRKAVFWRAVYDRTLSRERGCPSPFPEGSSARTQCYRDTRVPFYDGLRWITICPGCLESC